jgi:hypothetical protein
MQTNPFHLLVLGIGSQRIVQDLLKGLDDLRVTV